MRSTVLQLVTVFLPSPTVLLGTYVAMFASERTGLVGALAGIAVLGLMAKLRAWGAGMANRRQRRRDDDADAPDVPHRPARRDDGRDGGAYRWRCGCCRRRRDRRPGARLVPANPTARHPAYREVTR